MEYVYIINHHYSCEDPYLSPYTKTKYIFNTEQEAFEQYVIMEDKDLECYRNCITNYKRTYTENYYYIIKKYKLNKLGEESDSSEIIFNSIKQKIQKNNDKYEVVNI